MPVTSAMGQNMVDVSVGGDFDVVMAPQICYKLFRILQRDVST